MEHHHKIIVTGPAGVGKTTAISQISDISPVSSEQKTTSGCKKNKLIISDMDYGRMRLDNRHIIHLYGTQGQDRFNFIWEILTDDCLGVIILLDSTSPDSVSDLENFLESFKEYINKSAVVIGINKYIDTPVNDIKRYYEKLQQHYIRGAVFEVDLRNNNDSTMLIRTLLYYLNPIVKGIENDFDTVLEFVS